MILRDPVHGLVAFERPEEQVVPALMDTPEVQRLRRVRALGVASLAFPGAEHSRFVHAVGAAHVMSRFLARVGPLASRLGNAFALSPCDASDALAAALVHDVGHGPLSHLFEEVFPRARAHELWTSDLVLDPGTGIHRVLRAIDDDMPARVERLVHGVHGVSYLARAVSGTFDVDRCDYLLRDSHMTGVRYGLYDLDWLLRSLRLAPHADGPRLAIDGAKGLPAVEGYFLARLFMYQQVYFHKASRAAECMIRAVFARVADLVREGRPPAGTAPTILALARGESVTTGMYLSMDDNTLWSAMEVWADCADGILASLAKAVIARSLFKTASLDDDDPARDAARLAALQDIVQRDGLDPRYHASLDVAAVYPYEQSTDPGETLQVADDRRPARALESASFLVGRLVGAPFVRRRLVFPAQVRDKVEALLQPSTPRASHS